MNRGLITPREPPPSLKKSNSSFTSRFWWNFKPNIFICLQIIIMIEIYEQVPLTPEGLKEGLPSTPPPLLKEVKYCIYLFIVRFSLNLKHHIFICFPIIIEVNIFWMETPCSPPPSSNSQIFIYGAILLKFDTEQFHMLTNNNWD